MIRYDEYHIIKMLKVEYDVQATLWSTKLLKTFFEMEIVQSCVKSPVHKNIDSGPTR